MAYQYEESLIKALRDYSKLNQEIKKLEEDHKKIKANVQQWWTLNKIKEKEIEIVDIEERNTWKIMQVVSNRKSITDFEALAERLGEDTPFFVKESQSKYLKITKS